jgi:hypothetical protein
MEANCVQYRKLLNTITFHISWPGQHCVTYCTHFNLSSFPPPTQCNAEVQVEQGLTSTLSDSHPCCHLSRVRTESQLRLVLVGSATPCAPFVLSHPGTILLLWILVKRGNHCQMQNVHGYQDSVCHMQTSIHVLGDLRNNTPRVCQNISHNAVKRSILEDKNNK